MRITHNLQGTRFAETMQWKRIVDFLDGETFADEMRVEWHPRMGGYFDAEDATIDFRWVEDSEQRCVTQTIADLYSDNLSPGTLFGS